MRWLLDHLTTEVGPRATRLLPITLGDGENRMRAKSALWRLLTLLVLAALVAGMWVGWKLHPWMRPGQAIHIKSWKFGHQEFAVWQRKNTTFVEPFATGLFARRGSEQWRAFLLDFEDLYHPGIVLRKEATGVVVVRNGKRLGVFDEVTQTFTRESDGSSFTGTVIYGEPPGNWWIEQSKRE
jgi:hypothetical protein